MNSSKYLFHLCVAMGAILLLLVVPYRARNQNKSQGIQGDYVVYSFIWDPPLPYKASPVSPYCPDGGPCIPALMFEYAAYFLLSWGVYLRLSRSGESQLESYPGYGRGF